MKVHPYLTVVPRQNREPARRPQRTDSTNQSFRAEVESAEARLNTDVVEIISMENHRALNETAPHDLKTAEAILKQVQDDLNSMSKQDLAGIHRLEGLVHFYRS